MQKKKIIHLIFGSEAFRSRFFIYLQLGFTEFFVILQYEINSETVEPK